MRGVVDFAVGILVIVLLFFMVIMANLATPDALLHAIIREYRFPMEEIIMQQNLNHLLNVRVNGTNNLRVIDNAIGLRNCIEENNSYCANYYIEGLSNLSGNLINHSIAWGFYLDKVQVLPLDCKKEYYYFGGKLPIGICKPKVV